MSIIDNLKDSIKNRFIGKLSDADVKIEMAKRFSQKSATDGIVPYYQPMRLITLDDWKQALNMAQNPILLSRWRLYEVYENAMLDLHLTSITDTRGLELAGSKFKMLNGQKKQDPGAMEMLQAQWYLDYLKYGKESELAGYSLIQMMEQVDIPETVTLLGGTKAYKPLKNIDLVPRSHVRPEKGKWIINTFDSIDSGIDYTIPPNSYYYIGIGKKNDLGLLRKIAPIALAKRYALAAWGDYDEKLGIPFRYVTMKGSNNTREKMLANILANMGPAGWGIFHEGEEIKLLENSGSDVHKCFKELIELCDKQMSKVILGSTMTVDAEGGNYKGEVHAQTSAIRHEADKTFIEYLNNRELIPRLINLGYPLQGYKYQQDNTDELGLKDQIAIDQVLLQFYDIDPQYIADKYDVPIDLIKGKTVGNIIDVAAEAAKKKVQPAVKNSLLNNFEQTIINSVEKLYFGCKCGNHAAPKNSFSAYDEINRIINDVYSGKLKAGDMDEGLFRHQLEQFLSALGEGYGKDFTSIDYNQPDADMMENMRDNVYLFSGAKNYQELRAMTDLLIDADGNLKSKSDFKKDVLDLHSKYDQKFLAAEYDHAVVSGQVVSMWQKFQKEKKDLPFLRFNAVMDASTTVICTSRNDVRKHVDDPWWNINMIPLHWGERSTIDQDAEGEETDTSEMDLPEVKPLFQNNVGKTGTVFPEKHPYFQMPKKQLEKVKKFTDDQLTNDTEENN